MDLDDLNARVTEAILRAERLPIGSIESEAAFREVSSLEEAIAGLTSIKDAEGQIARLGAVAASLSGGDPLRALLLVERYLAEGLSGGAAARLHALRAEADADLAKAAVNAPLVRPLRYTLQEVA